MTQSNLSDALNGLRVCTASEWFDMGLSRARLRSLVRSSGLVRISPAVYATQAAVEWGDTSTKRGHALKALAASVAIGRNGVASHQSAALIYGLDLHPDPPDEVVLTRAPTKPQTSRSGKSKTDGIFFHKARLPDDHVTTVLGAQITTVARTVVDIARTSSFMSGVVTADSALRMGLDPEVDFYVGRQNFLDVCKACTHWPGVQNARRVAVFADPRAESVLESCARVVFHEHGLPPPELQAQIRGPNFSYYVDFYWAEYRVIAETDGKIKYSDPSRAIKQLRRDQQLRDNGDKVVHFTWDELFRKRTQVPDRIRRAFKVTSAV